MPLLQEGYELDALDKLHHDVDAVEVLEALRDLRKVRVLHIPQQLHLGAHVVSGRCEAVLADLSADVLLPRQPTSALVGLAEGAPRDKLETGVAILQPVRTAVHRAKVPHVRLRGVAVAQHAEGRDNELTKLIGAHRVASAVEPMACEQAHPPQPALLVLCLPGGHAGETFFARHREGHGFCQRLHGAQALEVLPVHLHIGPQELRQELPAGHVCYAWLCQGRGEEPEQVLLQRGVNLRALHIRLCKAWRCRWRPHCRRRRPRPWWFSLFSWGRRRHRKRRRHRGIGRGGNRCGPPDGQCGWGRGTPRRRHGRSGLLEARGRATRGPTLRLLHRHPSFHGWDAAALCPLRIWARRSICLRRPALGPAGGHRGGATPCRHGG
mmetsp:Transcript_30564/g.90684  ORF Transcript_30564/g.90684 Transcript_30564/m.90684 type:complete len:381 (+) Transcript_30564:1382-2524(+)